MISPSLDFTVKVSIERKVKNKFWPKKKTKKKQWIKQN